MISIKSLSHHYPGGRVINFPDLNIAAMEHWLLLGASGSGKSTLMNILSGLLKPTSGEVLIDGVPLYGLTLREMDKFRGARIGIVFQRPHLIRSLSVIENLDIAASMAGLTTDQEHQLMLLESLNIIDEKDKFPDQLSQGQLQRVSVARALVNKPDLLIADEPTSSLDDVNAVQVITMLREQAQANGAALLVATHDQRIQPFISNAYLL
ncbi:ABC transporter ATP-binding protein [Pedobacter sp. BMA]|uniref:ABC transporter ATP-binding protein n=1 Tax=Pedobacter sp. BMA TaxID=1663685 RepID=UPI0006497B92|nr:ATP-binding cassette domain-containing protein [Pedobacter sp. BMA]KLT66585.1 ABC transporter ATP-binding protein [Pedobacter sp. BMA]